MCLSYLNYVSWQKKVAFFYKIDGHCILPFLINNFSIIIQPFLKEIANFMQPPLSSTFEYRKSFQYTYYSLNFLTNCSPYNALVVSKVYDTQETISFTYNCCWASLTVHKCPFSKSLSSTQFNFIPFFLIDQLNCYSSM